MAATDDIDVEAMLEEAFMQQKEEREKRSSKTPDRKRSKRRSSDRHRRSREAGDDRRRRHSPPSRKRRSEDKYEAHSRHRSRSPTGFDNSKRRSKSPHYRPIRVVKSPELTPEERDIRTVFCMQLSARIRPRDLEEFFSEVGKVKDVRLITDPRTKKSKGVAYVEFKEVPSVQLAITMSGRKLLGVPIIVKPSNAEKNRQANPPLTPANLPNSSYGIAGMGIPYGIPSHSSASSSSYNLTSGPMKLYVGSLHFNITENMLREIFEPFGRIDVINLMRDPETNRSRGYAFITFAHCDDAKRALEQMNGFELAGRSIKVGHVTEKSTTDTSLTSNLDSDELDQRGISLGATGRLALMAKLADGSGLQMPQMALNALNYSAAVGGGSAAASALLQQRPPQMMDPASAAAGVVVGGNQVGTQCFMLSNMFEPGRTFTSQTAREIREDVIEECNKYGGLTHIYIDTKSSQGNVYVKCPSIATAVSCVNSLHGRYFSGRLIQGNYIPLLNYHQFFPDAIGANQLIPTERKS
ncbi:hypothetical protein GJ496_009157 [Pomphorhynchus laevis]|nr:hypothetical protein GJ496_009157 [Pomphorhynchus laevis]